MAKRQSNSARNSARPGRPFRPGPDPRRAKGGPGIGGRPRNEVRAACLLAFDERLPRLRELADSEDASVALKALDMLAKYGALSFTESAARVELDAKPAEVRTYIFPDNGKGDYYPSAAPEPGTPELPIASRNGWRGPERRRTPRGPDE